MSVKFSPIFNSQVVDSTGAPASGWKIYAYVAGSSTPLDTYTTSAGNVAQSNPIVLNALGFPTTGQIWLTAGSMYKLVLTNAADVVQKTEDNISGVNDSSVSVDEWIASGLTPTYVSTTSFTLVGDQTSAFHVGRRLQLSVTAGTVYGRITVSAYGVLTTVTVAMDGSQVLDSGLSSVNYGILRNNVLSIPERIATAAGTDTYTASIGATRLVIGDEYLIKIANANTSTTPTLNLDSLGAKTIKRQNGDALIAGQLSGQHTFRYDGTDMIVLNPVLDAELTTAGDTIYASAARLPVRLPIGTARQISRVNSGATAPIWDDQIKLVAPIASTSGTNIDFTGLPAGLNRINIMLDNVSTGGSSNLQIQLSVSGTFVTATYVSFVGAGTGALAATSGFLMTFSMGTTPARQGVITLNRMTGNTWAESGIVSVIDTSLPASVSTGIKALAGTLDGVRITTVSGDTFDLGSIAISYE